MRRLAAFFLISATASFASPAQPPEEKLAPEVVLVRGATIWTQGAQGRLENADLLVRRGRVVAVGRNLEAPRDAHRIDGSGKHVTPGLIDCHSHTAIRGGVNEGSNNVTAEVRINDVIDPTDINIYRQLAGGLTVAHQLHGSANSIGGQDAVIKLRRDGTRETLLMVGAPAGIKFALGENPKRSNFRNPNFPQRYPNSRMGVNQSIRETFLQAREYGSEWAAYNALSAEEQARREPPRTDLQLQAVLEILRGERVIHSHSYRQDEILALLRLAEEFDVRIATFQHVLEGYKVADELARHGAGASTFSDWWAYKLEAYDAIPHNGALMHDRGVVVSFNSDSSELARRMNLEAAKAVKYGGVDEVSALSFVTLNAAIQLGIDDRVGSLDKGKDGDFVVWSGHPLSTYSIVEQTWVNGVREFDRQADLDHREGIAALRAELIERVRTGDKPEQEAEQGEESEPAEEETPQPQPEPGPPPAYGDRLAPLSGRTSIVGATVHTLVGPPIVNGTVSFVGGRIVEVGAGLAPLPRAEVIDATGRHLYPGMIDVNSVLGLTEIGSVAGSVDTSELGDVNPNVNTALAVNPDSELIPVTRANGLTHSLTVPTGGLVSGSSSLTRLAGWTWEDLAAATPVAMHVRWPSFRIRTFSFFGPPPSEADQKKQREERLKKIRELFADARAYAKAKAAGTAEVDTVLESMLPVLDGSLPVAVHAGEIRQIKSAIAWAEEENLRIVLVGSGDVWRVADLLAAKRIPVVLSGVLSLPARRDEPYDTPFTVARKLHDAGVTFCIANSGSGFGASNGRNLPYHAAMAAAFGLPRDEAIRAVTLYPAKIFGLDAVLGSIEVGKSASLMLTDGDPLEIRTQVERLFIDGREAGVRDNKHDRLFERYAARPRLDE